MKKLMVIGLDCATPQFIFDSWRAELPNLGELMNQGVYGELKSTMPPITVPAWTSMLTSKDPGQLGFYGFRNRKNYNYEALYFANNSYVKEKRAWDYLGDQGLRSILIGIPQTYPPRSVNGIMVSSFLTPEKSNAFTYPDTVKEELDRVAEGDYIIDVRNFRTEDKDWLLDQIYVMTRRRFKAVRHYVRKEPWDFFMFVEMGVDRIHHGFWRYQDQNHRLYKPGGPFKDSIKDYYRYVDKEIGELIGCLDRDTGIMVVSDHGAKKMDGAVCINDWLIQKGYLRLNQEVEGPTRLRPDMVDWKNTRVWGEGGYYSRIFFNVQGREPDGLIPEKEYENFREKVKKELESLNDERGRPMGTRVLKPEEIYREVRNIPPDLFVFFGDLDWRGAGTVGNKSIHIFENDTGPDDANHAEYGIFIFRPDADTIRDAGIDPGKRLEGLSIYDIAPSILQYFGIDVPSDMIGRSVFRGIPAVETAGAQAEGITDQPGYYSEEEEEKIRERLEELGYI